MRRHLVPNPPWATEAVAHAYPTLQRAFRQTPQWLPEFRDITFAGQDLINASVKEYGCGAYGCVFPTLDPGVVLKVTTDDTEAQFADSHAATLVVAVTVAYHAVMPLNQQRGGRDIYLLWRESAQHVGGIDDVIPGDPLEIQDVIQDQHEAAQVAYEIIYKIGKIVSNGDVPDDAMIDQRDHALKEWLHAARAMDRIPELQFLAHGMAHVYEQQGIFFGDVHGGNIGMVTRQGRDLWVITDPGHVAVLT